jgi:hypothetical protein
MWTCMRARERQHGNLKQEDNTVTVTNAAGKGCTTNMKSGSTRYNQMHTLALRTQETVVHIVLK